MTSVIVSSWRSGSIGPKPVTSWTMSSTRASRSSRVSEKRVLDDDPVDDPGDAGPQLRLVGDVEEGLEGADRLALDAGPNLRVEGFPPGTCGAAEDRTPGRSPARGADGSAAGCGHRRGRMFDLDRIGDVLGGLLGRSLQGLLNPLAEGHEPDLPRARVADQMGLDRSRPH